MEYFEFEKKVSRKLRNESIQFDSSRFINDLDKNKNSKKKAFLFWPIGFLVAISLMAFNFEELFSFGNDESEMKSHLITEDIGAKSEVNTDDKELFEIDKKTKYKKYQHLSIETNTKVLSLLQSKRSTRDNNGLDEGLSVKASVIKDGGESFNFKNNNSSLLQLVEINSIATKPLILLDESVKVIDYKNKNIGCPDFSNPDRNAGIELVAEIGVFNPIKTLNDISGESNVITALRQQNEKPLIGVQAGLYVKYNLDKSPFYIFGGANYSKIIERTILDYELTEIDTSVGVVSITESELGDTITYIFGDIYSETTISGQKTRHYSMSSIDLPLHIGYELELNRLSIGIELGLALNITRTSNGQFLASQSDFLDLEDASVFKDRVGLRYDGKLFAAYQLSPNQKIYASVGLNILPQSIAIPESNINHTYKTIGFNVGYGFSF